MTNSIQGDFIQALVQLAPPGVTAREKSAWANTGAIYYQDDNFQTILGVSYDFQDGYASFNLTETTEAEREAIGARDVGSRPQDMTWFGWYADYAKGELGRVRDGVAHLLNGRVKP